jgi:predicted GNAT family acetyltransferase
MNFFAWFPRAAASAASSATFILRNLWHGRRLVSFDTVRIGEISIGPFAKDDLAAIEGLFTTLNLGKPLDFQMRTLLQLQGRKFCLAMRDGSDRIVGVGFYYFNARDRSNETIHVAYTGLDPSARGCGLGHALRLHALRHFARCGLASASSRISTCNQPSLKGNLTLGFLPVETYFDSAMTEQRQYLICRLDRYR